MEGGTRTKELVGVPILGDRRLSAGIATDGGSGATVGSALPKRGGSTPDLGSLVAPRGALAAHSPTVVEALPGGSEGGRDLQEDVRGSGAPAAAPELRRREELVEDLRLRHRVVVRLGGCVLAAVLVVVCFPLNDSRGAANEEFSLISRKRPPEFRGHLDLVTTLELGAPRPRTPPGGVSPIEPGGNNTSGREELPHDRFGLGTPFFRHHSSFWDERSAQHLA